MPFSILPGVLFLFSLSYVHATLPSSTSLACSVRQLGVDFSVSLQSSFRSVDALSEVVDALNGSPEADGCVVSLPSNMLNASASERDSERTPRLRVLSFPLPSPDDTDIFYVSPSTGVDEFSLTSSHAHGSIVAPFKSISFAVLAVRAYRSSSSSSSSSSSMTSSDRVVTLILREGVHYLDETIQLTNEDANLRFQAYEGEHATISGATVITGVDWKQATPPKRDLYEELGGYLNSGNDILTPSTMTLAEAQATCERTPECTGISSEAGISTKPADYLVTFYFKFANYFVSSGSNSSFTLNRGYSSLSSPQPQLYVADISSIQGITAPIETLMFNNRRLIRARYPNVKNVELLGAMQLLASSWTAQSAAPVSDVTFEPSSPRRSDHAANFFNDFRIGIGGPCNSRFTPDAAYWCANVTQGGGPGPYEAPVGMVASLPHAPYASLSTDEGAVSRVNIHTWRQSRWFSWVFAVSKYSYNVTLDDSNDEDDDDNGRGVNAAASVLFEFDQKRGGNQGSRGGKSGQEFYIDNVLEELDAPGEFYHDYTRNLLYVWFNSTDSDVPPSPSTVLTAATRRVLINATGNNETDPVKGITFNGIEFADTAPTYLEPHGTPSGGDWALARSGALFFESSEDVTIDGCVFRELDGHAIFLSGYARGALITRSEFVRIGESAVVSWGYTDGSPVTGLGFDATRGTQPRGTTVSYNIMHELGLYPKQNSAIFQSESFGNIYEGNIMYNGPRAGINFNDGMGGGSKVISNVLFNFCRESSDHGNFNSWDRQTYLVDQPDGSISTAKVNDTIAHNWMLANYQASMAIDNDDGSCYFDTHSNVLIGASAGADYGGYSLKSDYGGHSNFHHDNLDLFWSEGFSIDGTTVKHADGYYNNYLLMTRDGNYGGGQTCSDSASTSRTIVFNNTIWSPTGAITECGQTLSSWQSKDPLNNDVGTVAQKYDSAQHDALIIGIARRLLQA